MHEANDNREPEDVDAMPGRLVSELKTVVPRAPFIPPVVDESILRAARRHLAPEGPKRTAWLAFLRWSTAAVAVCLAAVLAHLAIHSAPGFAREDINRDGRVDILDAFVLAQHLRANGPAGTRRGDINDDGLVDQADIRAIATRAVALRKGSNS